MQTKTITEIRQLMQSESFNEDIMNKLRVDKRKGIQQLINTYERQRAKKAKQKKQFLRLQSFDYTYVTEDSQYIAGIDEAGRGPLAGPVVAAAVILPKKFVHYELNDSKALSETTRNALFHIIINEAICYSVAKVQAEEIDGINIYEATKKAMNDALTTLLPTPDVALVDAMRLSKSVCPIHSIIKGDTKSLAIAAASIVAKVTRDNIMNELHEQYPVYNFRQNKGYGTKEHLEALQTYGPTKYHRNSFAPVQLAMKQNKR